jgi:hypothetical protein
MKAQTCALCGAFIAWGARVKCKRCGAEWIRESWWTAADRNALYATTGPWTFYQVRTDRDCEVQNCNEIAKWKAGKLDTRYTWDHWAYLCHAHKLQLEETGHYPEEVKR